MIVDEINWAVLQDYIYSHKYTNEHTVHGLDHWNQVEYNGLMLAKKNGADITVIRLFALFHDSCRYDDGYDPEHGPRGAAFAEELRGKLYELDDQRFDWLYHACKFHTHEISSGIVTVDTCYDADRLDLGRVSIAPAVEKMATEAGRKLVRKAKDVPIFRMREWIRSL
jgi:uncharacterized protein